MVRQRSEIVLRPSARDAIIAETLRRLPLESGGILLGYREDHTIVVTDAFVVTPSTAHANRYVRDDVRANVLLQKFLANRDRDDPTGYVGEWHSHPARSGPSSIDIDAIRATARATSGPIALVVHSPKPKPKFVGVIASRQRFRRTTAKEANVNVLEQQDLADLGPLPSGAVRGDGPVFISYRQSDGTPLAENLEGLLRSAGLVVWRDRSDLRAGTTTDRLEQALTEGLSAAVLVVTAEVEHSVIVKQRELPRLLQLDEDPRFSLSFNLRPSGWGVCFGVLADVVACRRSVVLAARRSPGPGVGGFRRAGRQG